MCKLIHGSLPARVNFVTMVPLLLAIGISNIHHFVNPLTSKITAKAVPWHIQCLLPQATTPIFSTMHHIYMEVLDGCHNQPLITLVSANVQNHSKQESTIFSTVGATHVFF